MGKFHWKIYWSKTQKLSEAYIRPIEWLPMSDLTVNDQQIEILVYIQDCDSNFTQFVCEWDYRVDWGDWSVEDIVSWVKACHDYDYSNILLNNSTVSKYKYKQTKIIITPQTWQNLTSFNADQYHTSIWSSLTSDKTQPWLDIIIAWPNITNLTLWASTQNYVSFYNIEIFKIVSILDSDLSYLCSWFRSLRQVDISWISSVTNMSNIFTNCTALTTTLLLDTSSVTNMASMFLGCTALTTIPLLDTSSVTDMTSMFGWCRWLTTIPLLDTSSVINMSNMFVNCNSLLVIPLLDTSSVTNMTGMFSWCFPLTIIPPLNTWLTTTVTNIFNWCYSLKRILTQFSISFSIINWSMSSNALDELFTALPIVTWQTITITWNYWATLCDTSIATWKWRTVV